MGKRPMWSLTYQFFSLLSSGVGCGGEGGPGQVSEASRSQGPNSAGRPGIEEAYTNQLHPLLEKSQNPLADRQSGQEPQNIYQTYNKKTNNC